VANSALALATFVRPRAVVTDRSTAPELFWMPYDRTLWEMGEILCDAQVGRVERAWKLPLIFRRRLKAIREFFA
jgi:hypothetical protein